MVAAALEEGVEQVADVRHDAALFCRAQQRQVPLAQAVRARSLLLVRVTVQDVVVALCRTKKAGYQVCQQGRTRPSALR